MTITHPASVSAPRADETAGVPAGDIDLIAINTIRTLAIDAVEKADSGHAGAPMGLAPVAYTLWRRFLRYDPDHPDWPNRDRFVLSNGHASMLLYALLFLAGVKRPGGKPAVSLDDIKQFRELGSVTPGHPEYGHTTGVETTTGPLGQGVGNSVGMAMAERWLAERFNKPGLKLFDYNVYAICSDGDLMEGISGEAASLAGHLKLSNLCWIYDDNGISIEGPTSLTFSEDVATRFAGYGWTTHRVEDANDCEAFAAAVEAFQATADRPTLILVKSIIGYGSPHEQGTAKAHSDALGAEEVKLTKRAYGWPEDAQFLVPDGVRERFDEGMGRRGRALREDWETLLARYGAAHGDLAAELAAMRARTLPDGWDKDLPTFPADAKGIASRDASGKSLNAIAPRLPWLIGGSADLSPSTKTHLDFDGAGDFQPGSYGGRNLHFGIREHVMGAVANGLALSSLRPYTGTFLVFSDYMRPPMRLAALMGAPVVFVFSHDSVGLGQDGPTHQPIEQLAGLRAVPGLMLLRPGDANETVEAWRTILAQSARPACLVLSRQALPTLDRSKYAPAAGVARGAYVLADAKEGAPKVILIGTGSELSLCVEAYERLTAEGEAARVVSMPSWDRFEAQDRSYRDEVLPPSVTARVAIEAAAPLGWDRYVGPSGAIIAMHGFGASAPIKDVMPHFGFTADHVYEAARAQLTGAGGATKMSNPLLLLESAGQAVWLDYLHRKILDDGELKGLIANDGLKGLTSNPSIFEKAIGDGDAYDDRITALLQDRETPAPELYEQLAIADIQAAADQFRPVYDRLDRRDGYVSLEVSPQLAMDTDGTIAEARRLWAAVNRPNLMIKVPGTVPGVPAIRQLISEGINVNVTLLFGIDAYLRVAEAHIAGLEAFGAAGGDVAEVHGVASFFVSRIDVKIDAEIDRRLEAGGATAQGDLIGLRGKVAIANAKIAYQHYLALVAGPRWKALAAAGASPQRLLWASTGAKDPTYSDTLYIDSLIGPDTVNTMPPKTMDAFRDHGRVSASLADNVAGARDVLARTEAAGLNLAGVTDTLVVEGVKQFADAFDALLSAVGAKRARILGER